MFGDAARSPPPPPGRDPGRAPSAATRAWAGAAFPPEALDADHALRDHRCPIGVQPLDLAPGERTGAEGRALRVVGAEHQQRQHQHARLRAPDQRSPCVRPQRHGVEEPGGPIGDGRRAALERQRPVRIAAAVALVLMGLASAAAALLWPQPRGNARAPCCASWRKPSGVLGRFGSRSRAGEDDA